MGYFLHLSYWVINGDGARKISGQIVGKEPLLSDWFDLQDEGALKSWNDQLVMHKGISQAKLNNRLLNKVSCWLYRIK